MSRAGRGKDGNGKWTQAAIGGVVIGATFLLTGEEPEPPRPPGEGTPPDSLQAREQATMPDPGFGMMRLTLEPEAAPPPARPRRRKVEPAPVPEIAAENAALAEPQTVTPAAVTPAAPELAQGAEPLPAPEPPAAAGPAVAVASSPRLALAAAPVAANTRLVLPKPAFVGQASAPTAGLPTAGLPTPTLTAGAIPPMASFVPAAPFTADDELILQVETAHGEVSDTMIAYGTRAGVYLPLGELARLLDLAIAISDDGHYAAGWVLDEKHVVAINLRQGTLRRDGVNGGVDIALSPRDAAAFDGELYLRAERFADLMPLALTVDLRAQTVAVKTRTPFPFEQRAARETAREHLGSRAQNHRPQGYPREETPWRAATVPLADVELRGVSDTTYGNRSEADLRLAGDLAFMTARVFASASSRDGLTAARVELGRRDPDARLLGPLRATEFQLGDVSTASLPIPVQTNRATSPTVSYAKRHRLQPRWHGQARLQAVQSPQKVGSGGSLVSPG